MRPQDAGQRGCEKYAELVSAYLDDELNASELLELAGHLKGCPACSRLLEEFMEMKDLLRQADGAFRLYAGAYGAATQAVLLQDLLTPTGAAGDLVPRVGSVP